MRKTFGGLLVLGLLALAATRADARGYRGYGNENIGGMQVGAQDMRAAGGNPILAAQIAEQRMMMQYEQQMMKAQQQYQQQMQKLMKDPQYKKQMEAMQAQYQQQVQAYQARLAAKKKKKGLHSTTKAVPKTDSTPKVKVKAKAKAKAADTTPPNEEAAAAKP